jgi:hypothetical protein
MEKQIQLSNCACAEGVASMLKVLTGFFPEEAAQFSGII